jgi:hypothetical protein
MSSEIRIAYFNEALAMKALSLQNVHPIQKLSYPQQSHDETNEGGSNLGGSALSEPPKNAQLLRGNTVQTRRLTLMNRHPLTHQATTLVTMFRTKAVC